MFFHLCVLICCFISTISAQGASTGVVRLYRNGVADTSQSWSSGIVQIYYSSQWGNICDDSSFGSDEADVICHQLGYSGSSSYSNTGTTSTWGSDSSSTVMDDVSCSSSSYLTITQCFFSTFISFSCTNSRDVTVSCYSTRIWNSPTTGDIRLTGGTYSNQGLLEVYCNSEWGTVCNDYFGATEARVACKQLGYNYYDDYNHLSQRGTSSQEIFLRSLSGCTSFDDCLTECGGCPSSGISACSHSEDITLECRYSSSYSKVYTETSDYCIYYDYSSVSSGAIVAAVVGSIIGFIVCIIVIIAVPICICVCLGVGIGAASRSGTRSRVVTTQPPVTTTAVVTQDTANTTTGYPTQPAQPAYYPANPNQPTEYQPPPPAAGNQQPPPGYSPYQPTPGNYPQQQGPGQVGYTGYPQ